MSGSPSLSAASASHRPVRPLQLSLASLFFWTVMGAAWFLLFRVHVGLGIVGGVLGLPPLARTLWHMHRSGDARPWPIECQATFFIESFALTVVTLSVCGFLFAAVGVLTGVIALFVVPMASALLLGGMLGVAAAAAALRVVLRDHW